MNGGRRRELRDPEVEHTERSRRASGSLSPARRELHLYTPSRQLSMDHSRFLPTTASPRHVHCVYTPRRRSSGRVPSLFIPRGCSPPSRQAPPPITSTLSSVRSHARARESGLYLVRYTCVWEADGGIFVGTRAARSCDEALFLSRMYMYMFVREIIRVLYGLCRGERFGRKFFLRKRSNLEGEILFVRSYICVTLERDNAWSR